MPNRSPVFLGAGEVRPDPGWHMPPHRHKAHELIVILTGRMRLEIDGRTLAVGAGDLLFYRAGRVHEETSDRKAPVGTFYIVFKAAEDALDQFTLRLHDADGRARQMAAWLVRDQRAGVAPEQQVPLLCALLDEIRRLRAKPVDPWLANQRQHMQKHLADRLYLDDLARHSGMSKFAYVRKFRRLGGITPMRELQHIRLNQARTLMLTTGLPMKAIAPAVGLGDEYQLSKLCRRHFRISPRELRSRMSGRRVR
jgi:AraC-like DNA-binding protein